MAALLRVGLDVRNGRAQPPERAQVLTLHPVFERLQVEIDRFLEHR
jgi:hypothetical protein